MLNLRKLTHDHIKLIAKTSEQEMLEWDQDLLDYVVRSQVDIITDPTPKAMDESEVKALTKKSDAITKDLKDQGRQAQVKYLKDTWAEAWASRGHDEFVIWNNTDENYNHRAQQLTEPKVDGFYSVLVGERVHTVEFINGAWNTELNVSKWVASPPALSIA
ncbi:hypothetical protein [Vibrio sp. D431a]|uniref:hypothetical protein n=1 Tax=Vibrio sp. D431a TaxID=2837388 RepID=UPI0025570D51|nr:hypothetical protein [Vibrio sp. D431a]MDK9793786.1 hypothetical protein [Vibrio sp. D431a]